MTINILCVGGLKEKYWQDACAEYLKRIKPFAKVNIVEIKESLLPQNASSGQIMAAKLEEASRLRQKAKGFLITLEVLGQNLSSEQFAAKIDALATSGHSEISFIIGGSNGLDKQFSDECDIKLSFSAFTFAHQLMRVILIEQIYRAMCINTGKIYHK